MTLFRFSVFFSSFVSLFFFFLFIVSSNWNSEPFATNFYSRRNRGENSVSFSFRKKDTSCRALFLLLRIKGQYWLNKLLAFSRFLDTGNFNLGANVRHVGEIRWSKWRAHASSRQIFGTKGRLPVRRYALCTLGKLKTTFRE